MYGNSQLIELVWRNSAYQNAIKSPGLTGTEAVNKGAMFGGFRTTSSCAYSQNDAPSKRLRSEYETTNRVLAYPGELFDKKYRYVIGPADGWDKDSSDLPMDVALVRTTPTDRENYTGPEANPNWSSSTPSWNEIRRYTASAHHDADAPTAYAQVPGTTLAKTDNSSQKVEFVDDLNWANEGETTMTMDLEQSITGANCQLKKIVLQFSKEYHHISEVTIDFSDITRAQGSISSSTHPQANMITLLLDGKEKLHTAYFDCAMGKFGANKFKMTIKSIKFFPPMVSGVGGFDPGSQIARDVRTTYRVPVIQNFTNANPLEPELQTTPPEQKGSAHDRVVNTVNSMAADGAYSWKYYGGDAVDVKIGEQGEPAAVITANGSSGFCEYTCAPRETRGSLLSCAVYLQADT